MDFFISSAHAEDSSVPAVPTPTTAQPAPAANVPAPQQPDWFGIAMPLVVLGAFYIFFLRPQQKRAKEQKQMIDSLAKGTEVVTTGGVLGRVVEVDDSFVLLEVGDNTTLYIQRHAIGNIVPKGTYKTRKKA